MERLVYVVTSKYVEHHGMRSIKDYFTPETYGAVKSTPRDHIEALWLDS